MNRRELLSAVHALPGAHPPQGYYIESPDTDDHPEHYNSFCYEHGRMVALGESILSGFQMYATRGWSGDDSVQRCAWHRCDQELDMGGLTSCGVDCALALTESDPYRSSVTPAELALSAESMLDDDKRWDVWVKQATRVLRQWRRRKR